MGKNVFADIVCSDSTYAPMRPLKNENNRIAVSFAKYKVR